MDQLKRTLDLPGKIIISWFIAGAILAGGMLVAYGLFMEVVAHYMLIEFVGGLYLMGGLLAYIAGGALGMFGRPIGMKASSAFADQVSASLYTILLAAVAFVVAAWIALTYAAVYSGSIVAITLASFSWLIGAVIVAVAMHYGWFGLKNVGLRALNIPKYRLRIQFVKEEKLTETE